MKLHSIALATLGLLAGVAKAAPIDWNTWSSASSGLIPGGTIVAYSSPDAHNLVSSYPSYLPGTTFADGGVVNNGPVPANGILQIFGGTGSVNTLTFSTAVVNPVMAIWSLGQSGINASFVFNQTPVLVSGGPNAEYGGSPISVIGNTVSGVEGNGTVQFVGTFTSLSWTNPVFENWYGFNVGIAGVAAAVPEPETYALMLAGLGVMGGMARRRRSH